MRSKRRYKYQKVKDDLQSGRASKTRPAQFVYDGRQLVGLVRETDAGFVAYTITGNTKRSIGAFSTLTAATRALPSITDHLKHKPAQDMNPRGPELSNEGRARP